MVSTLLASFAHAVTFHDPVDDVLDKAKPPLVDLTSASVEIEPDQVVFTLTFSDTTSLSAITLLSGTIEIDVDQSAGTGRTITRFDEYELEPRINLGVDYWLEFIPGNPQADFVYMDPDGLEVTLQSCLRTVAGRTMTLEVPRSHTSGAEGLLLGSPFDVAFLVGSTSGPTDRAPNEPLPFTVPVPEPAAALFLALGSCLTRRRSRPF